MNVLPSNSLHLLNPLPRPTSASAPAVRHPGPHGLHAVFASALLAASGATHAGAPASAGGVTGQGGGHCSTTAGMLYDACAEAADAERIVASAKCGNLRDAGSRQVCTELSRQAHAEAMALCKSQRDWRLASCLEVGEQRYDPSIVPAKFDSDYHHLSHPNPYFPLDIGASWEFRGGGDKLNTVEVVNETKLIEGVTAITVRDLVYFKGRLHEATDDWYAAGRDGTTWYLGEEVKNYESFKGDRPRAPELVSVGGSFKHGRNGDKGGIIMPASPTVGQAYLEEFSLANAEDVAAVLSASYAWGHSSELDEFVPEALARHLCADGDCVVTKNYSLLEPGVVTRKYYARSIGFFLETEIGFGIDVQLTACNVDPRCATLPPP
jgi:hypothetical protein